MLECGGYFFSTNGTIKYPESNTTLEYKSNLNCAWIINVSPTNIVNISFNWIDIENSTDCSFDSITVQFNKITYL